VRKGLGLTIAAIVPFAVAAVVLTSRSVTASLPPEPVEHIQHSERVADTPAPPAVDDDEERVESTDLFGNQVSAAVARYKFDATGSLYELHSPQTELPRLGSPKS
jgi:hypothetical protein